MTSTALSLLDEPPTKKPRLVSNPDSLTTLVFDLEERVKKQTSMIHQLQNQYQDQVEVNQRLWSKIDELEKVWLEFCWVILTEFIPFLSKRPLPVSSTGVVDPLRSPDELDSSQPSGFISDCFESMFSPQECASPQSRFQPQHSEVLDSRLPEGALPSDVVFMRHPEANAGFLPSHISPQVSETDDDIALLARLISDN